MHDISVPIAVFIAMEFAAMVPLAVFTVVRERSAITAACVIAVIHMASEMFRSAIPRTRTDKHTAHEPLRPVVAVRRTVVRRVVEIAVGACGRRADIHTDGNLGFHTRWRCSESQGSNHNRGKACNGFHEMELV